MLSINEKIHINIIITWYVYMSVNLDRNLEFVEMGQQN